ncbi:MAG: cytochrome c [Acidobacteriota bacterium]|nr:cytochrome c [Acidobacteriota bacterium]
MSESRKVTDSADRRRSSADLWTVVAQSLGFAFLAVLGALILSSAAPAAAAGDGEADAPGRMVFMDAKCNLCHGIDSLGIEAKTKSEKLRGKDLSTIGADHDAEWFTAFLKREIELDGAKHKKGFTGSDEELMTLVNWLTELKPAS